MAGSRTWRSELRGDGPSVCPWFHLSRSPSRPAGSPVQFRTGRLTPFPGTAHTSSVSPGEHGILIRLAREVPHVALRQGTSPAPPDRGPRTERAATTRTGHGRGLPFVHPRLPARR